MSISDLVLGAYSIALDSSTMKFFKIASVVTIVTLVEQFKIDINNLNTV